MFINYPDLEGNLNCPDVEENITFTFSHERGPLRTVEASVDQVAAKGTWLKLDGFGDAGHQLRKSCPPPTPFPPCRPLVTPGTLSQCAEWHHPARQCLWHAQVGNCGCHRLDELTRSSLRIENGELPARQLQQYCTPSGLLLHPRFVRAHQVEQSTHLPHGLLRLPACLQGA